MGTVTQASSTALTLLEVYKAAGEDYTGLAEYSDVSGYQNGTNDYTIEAHAATKAECSGMKPNTRVWPRLDGRDLSPYCRMNNDTSSFGDPLRTDSKGNCDFLYKIPNDATMKFRGLKHLLELSDVKPPAHNSGTYGISSGKIGATTRCGQYIYFPSNTNGFDYTDVSATSNISLTELIADQSKTVVSSSKVEEEVPDFLSQSFTIAKDGIDGVFCKKVYLYFSDKPTDSNSYVIVQLREAGRDGRPTDKLIAESERVYTSYTNHPDSAISGLSATNGLSHQVNADSNAMVSTTFRFPEAVSLKNNMRYALTVIPHEPNSEFKLWTAVDNSKDVSSGYSGINASFKPYMSELYGSASGNVWSRLPNEAIKMFLSSQNYVTNTTSSFVFENEDLEFLNISDISPTGEPTATTGFQIDEKIRGESTLTIDHDVQLFVGNTIQNAYAKDNVGYYGYAQYADGTIRSIGNSGATGTTGATGTVTVKIDAIGSFDSENTETLYIGSQAIGTVGATNGFVANTCFGYASFINTDFGRLRLRSSNADSSTTQKFQAGKYIRGLARGASAKIDAVVNPKIDEIDIRSRFRAGNKTSLDWYIKTTDAGTTSIDTDWERISGGKQLKFTDKQKQIYSKSSNSYFGSSMLIKGEMSSTDSRVSPEAHIDDMAVVAKRQRINNSTVGETNPAGNATARFVSKVLRANRLNAATGDTTGQPSERLVIHCDAYYPEGSGITAYIRAKNDSDPEKISDKQYTLMGSVNTTDRSVLGETQDKVSLVFFPAANVAGDSFLEAPSGQLGATGVNNLRMDNTDRIIKYQSSDGSIYEGINDFQIKLVFTKPDNSGTAYAPEITDLIAISHDKPLEIT